MRPVRVKWKKLTLEIPSELTLVLLVKPWLLWLLLRHF